MKLPEFLQRRPLVYRVYDIDERLIYVGHSCNIQQRLRDHRIESWWYSLGERISIQLHPTKEAAHAAESVAIQEEQPAFNVWHTGRKPNSFDHWTDDDHIVCGIWQQSNGKRSYLPPVPSIVQWNAA